MLDIISQEIIIERDFKFGVQLADRLLRHIVAQALAPSFL